MSAVRILMGPGEPRAEYAAAVHAGGGTLVTDPTAADAVLWLHPRDPAGLTAVLDAGPGIRWVQLPFAGIEPYLPLVRDGRTWTCGKGVYADPVAEMALGMLLAGMRQLVGYARARTWTPPLGVNLFDADVTILGGGEIARALIALLTPFRCRITVLRRTPTPMPGVATVGTLADLTRTVAGADAVVLALALTPETERIIDAEVLAAMQPHAWLVNVARGRHIDTDALVAALAAGRLGGAALDVVDPEPLPDDHPLWREPCCLISPHTGNTPEMAVPLLATRIRSNVARFATRQELIGPVDPVAGY
jgi:phosphoglycerate dehydrogenase-like enzyme